MWTLESFTAAGLPAQLYDDLKYIAHDEEGHVTYLEAGLTAAGAMPVQACTYSFPMTTPKEFVSLASVIEGVGVSAYVSCRDGALRLTNVSQLPRRCCRYYFEGLLNRCWKHLSY